MTGTKQPLARRFDLASTRRAVGEGRSKAATVFDEWELPENIAADAVLVISELLSNAVQHGTLPREESDGDTAQCSLLLFLTARGLTVSVYDFDPKPPVVRAPTEEDTRGRGLLLVSELSTTWGYTPLSPDPGKLVWARLVVPPTWCPGSGDLTSTPAPSIPTSPLRGGVDYSGCMAALPKEASGP